MKAVTTVERAFELARSGECVGVDDVRRVLKRERHDAVDAHLAGPSLTKRLRALCEEARQATGGA